MVSPVLAAKEKQDIPDSYGIKVCYLTGKIEEIEAASHRLVDKIWQKGNDDKMRWEVAATPFYEIWSTDNICTVIPMNAVQSITFDKQFSKLVEIKERMK